MEGILLLNVMDDGHEGKTELPETTFELLDHLRGNHDVREGLLDFRPKVQSNVITKFGEVS